MITINKNTSNLVVLTLTEKSQLTEPTYNLFVFTNQSTNVTKIFTASDMSIYKDRYNAFTIVESASTENLLIGEIYMTGDTSQWAYEVYESQYPYSAGTLAISATTGTILESGRVLLNGQETNNTINEIYL
jgi:hypothetical protein